MPQLQPFWDDAYTAADPGPYVGPVYVTNAWDTGKIKGVQVPGIVSVSVPRKRAFWVISVPGAVPTPIKIGYEPLRFTMTIRIWTPGQWEALQPIMWMLQPIADKKRPKGTKSTDTAFDVYHPILAAMSVHSVICETCGPLTGGQEKTLTIQFLEYRTSGNTSVATIDKALQDAAEFNAETLAAQQVQAADGRVTTFAPTQGPQPKPSRAELTLVPTT